MVYSEGQEVSVHFQKSGKILKGIIVEELHNEYYRLRILEGDPEDIGQVIRIHKKDLNEMVPV